MINTIFYFPESLTFDQYTNLLDSDTDEGIARRTIVFARQQGKIYNNGKLYGTTSSDVQSLIDATKKYLEGLIDDTKVDFNSLIEKINGSLDGVRNDLDNVLSRESDGINQMIEDVINSKGFIDGWQAGWDNNIKAYLIQAGIVDANNNKGWAYLETKYNELKALVNSIDVGDGLTAEVVSSLIDARIEENSSITELKSRYALTNEDKTVLKWLSAGLYSEANANASLTSVFASAESVATNTRAISGLTTRVSDLEGEDFLTESSLVSEIIKQQGDISTVLSGAGLVNIAKLNEATSTLASRLDSVEDTSGNNVDAISALLLSVQNLEENGAPATESSVISAINVHKDDVVATLSSAGLINTAKLNEATSTLQTNINNVSSRIVSKSEIENIAGEAVETATAGMVVESDLDDYVEKASIILSINSSGESNATIDADKINLNGTVIAQRLLAAGAAIGGFTIGQDSLRAGDSYNNISLSPSSGFCANSSEMSGDVGLTNSIYLDANGLTTETFRTTGHTTTNQINIDGSGFLASGALNWDENGNLQIGGGANGFSGSLVLGGTELIANYTGSIISASTAGSFRVYSQDSSLYTPHWFTIQGSHPGAEKLSIYSTATHAEVYIGDEANHPGDTIDLLVDGDVYINKTTTNLVNPGGNLYVEDNVTATSFTTGTSSSGNSTTIDGTSIKVNQAAEGLSNQYVEIEPNNILFEYSNGDVCNVNLKSDGLNFDSLVVALGFATKDGTGSILLDNGNTMTLAELKAALNAI